MSVALRTLDAPATSRLEWKRDFEVGHEVVDAQHRALVRSINRIFEQAATPGRTGLLIELLDELIMETMQHFRDEEDVLARAGCVGLDEHRRKHLELVGQMLTHRHAVQQHELPLSALLDYLADEIVDRHIRGEDRAIFGSLGAAG